MPTIVLDDESIYYVVRGTHGPATVFVHGAGSNHLIWNGQIAALSESATCYGIDLPGHGHSSGAGRASIDAYRDVLVAFLDALKIERAFVVGHSMGGAITQTLALSHLTRVAGIGLVGTGARLRVLPEFLSGIQSDFETTVKKINRNSFADAADPSLVAASEKDLLACPPAVVFGDYSACNGFDLIARVEDIRVPTLVLCGAQDRMTPPKYSEFLAARIPNARWVAIDNAGHDVMLEQPAAVNRALREWIAPD